MAFGLPAFFGRKTRTIVPPGVDVTSITDISGSMGPYASFVTSPLLYEALETALQAESIGTAAGQTNRYSFCIGVSSDNGWGGGYPSGAFIPLSAVEQNILLNGVSQRWASGTNVLTPGSVTYPSYSVGGGGTEDMARAANTISRDPLNPRNYILSNERIIIAGSDEQSDQYGEQFNLTPEFSYRYVGIHRADLGVNETPGLTPKPTGTLVGFVYTTASEGVAIYIDGSTINYRSNMPTSAFTATATAGTKPVCIDQCKITNGALYNIGFFTNAARYALLGESLGSVLGRYLYSVS